MSEHSHHISSVKLLFTVGIALFLLTFLTTGVHYIHLPQPYSVIAALVIAFFKASLVALFFMNLYWDKKFNLMLMVTGVAFMLLLLALTMTDVAFRTPIVPSF